MTSNAAVSVSYAVFTFQVDSGGAVTIPIGVALWSPERPWVRVRFVGENERLRQFNSQEHFPFVNLVRQKIGQWITAGELPYCDQPLLPSVDGWWRHVRDLLVHRVRLSEPRSIDCHNPEEELEPLYESVVSSHRSERERRTRVAGEIRRCLDELPQAIRRKFKAREALDGFRGRKVKVLRSYHGERGWVVIEGVNLASSEAEAESDATVSRLLRLREGVRENTEILIGYLASPEGLNGEGVLVEWMAHQTKARVLDLTQQRSEFRETAKSFVDKADGVSDLF